MTWHLFITSQFNQAFDLSILGQHGKEMSIKNEVHNLSAMRNHVCNEHIKIAKALKRNIVSIKV